ncbi:hypothetical protein ACH4XT_34445 [Streptomyces avidinii]|uniref:hypothetical protein n=1 Tax=Streptomyces avidinii TaxID=1895 RepID=UPI0037BC553E
MTSIPERYTREIHTKYGYLACWLPSTRLALGDVGLLSEHGFRKVSTLDEMGIAFTRGAESKIVDLDYSSADCVAVAADTRLEVAPAGLATRLSITFDEGGATFFQASDCVQESMADLLALQAALRERYRSGAWRREYVVVTEVVRTGPTAILVSEQQGARIDLRVSAGAMGGPLAVAGALGRYTVTSRSGIAASVLAPEGATPLFRAAQLRRRLVGQPELVFRSDEDEDEDDVSYRGSDAVGGHASADDPSEWELDLTRLAWSDVASWQRSGLHDVRSDR